MNNIFKEIKIQIKDAMKSKDVVKRDILRLVVGQVQQSDDESDDAVIKVIKKIVKSNTETLAVLSERALHGESIKILEENNVLLKFVPQAMSEEEIKEFVKENNIDLSSAKNSGQAMGMLMKPLKASGKEVDATTVKKAVEELIK